MASGVYTCVQTFSQKLKKSSSEVVSLWKKTIDSTDAPSISEICSLNNSR